MTPTLHIDFETRSAVDLKKAGAYVYAEDPSTDVWCAAHCVDDGLVRLWVPGDALTHAAALDCPPDILRAVREGWTIVAHNANFERIIWRHVLTPKYGWPEPKLTQWRCTMAMALAMSLPASLENAAAAVGLEARKDMDGHATMMRMAKPRRPRKGEYPNGVYWFDDPERKEKLYAYCKNDVEVERQLSRRLLALRPFEQKIWWLDQLINDRGVAVDTDLARAALKIVETVETWLDDEMRTVTRGVVTACSNVGEITGWLRANGLPDVKSISKDAVDDLLLLRDIPASVRRVLELRREAAKASVAKIDSLLAGRSRDGRARGLLQYHAASTGRWAGRRFQPQNIKRPELEDVDAAIETVLTGDAELVRATHGEPLAVVGDCLRGMIRAAPGARIIAADFSNIEGRLIAWFGREQWKLDAFRAFDAGTGPDIYKLAYARSFGIKPEAVDKPQRQIGKVMELALGYAGGVGAFQKMASGYGVEMTDERADELKVLWRKAHPGVVEYWRDLERCAVASVEERGRAFHAGAILFKTVGSFAFMRLPSGRSICYPYPQIELVPTPWGSKKPTFTYMGVDSYTRKWERCQAHGGVLFNNVVQGTARDVEAEARVRVERAGYPVVLSIHDEVVSEPRNNHGSVEDFECLMTIVPGWLPGCPIAASGFEAGRYRK